MAQSEQIDKLAEALAQAQVEFDTPSKSATNPFLKNKYADISDVLHAVKPTLAKFGVAAVQMPGISNGRSVIRTILAHKSGQWIDGEMPVLNAKEDAQSFGSGVTYARRYSLKAALGIADDDDDGNGATGKAEVKKPASTPAQSSQAKAPDAPPAAKDSSPKQEAPEVGATTQATGSAAPATGSTATATTPAGGAEPEGKSGASPGPAGADTATESAKTASDAPVSKEQMLQLLKVGDANGWTKQQISAFVAFAFASVKAGNAMTEKQWAQAVGVVSHPTNAKGKVRVSGSGAKLAANLCWPQEAK
ncbi:MAG: ERF family protein [Patescibacteria group bacterium]|nr:ERF family protein [Patescibacteria group bacterium]